MGIFTKKSSSERVILVALADTHGGSKYGLLSPEVILYDESPEGDLVAYTPTLSVTQEYFWKLYLSHIQEVKKIAGRDKIVVLHVGDLTQGLKYPQALVSTRIADQLMIAIENMKPWCEMENVTHIRFAVGTASHEFQESTSPIVVSNMLAEKYKSKNIELCQHGLADIAGLSVDYAHHGPSPGIRVWTHGNVARYYLRDIMLGEINHGCAPPELVVRAHYHTPVEEYLKIGKYKSWLYVLPAYCAPNLHARQVTKSISRMINGLNVYEIVGGEIVRTHELHSAKDIRTKEKILCQE